MKNDKDIYKKIYINIYKYIEIYIFLNLVAL